jgi:hypothetical protein
MHRDEARAAVAKQFAETLQQSEVKLTALPPDQLRVLVDAIGDSIFAVLESWQNEDDATQEAAAQRAHTAQVAVQSAAASGETEASDQDDLTQPDLGEELLWRGRPYLTIGTRYELTNQRLRIIRGILGNTIEEIELVRVRDTKVKQHAGERLLNVGDVTVISADPITPEFELSNVKNPLEVRELIRKATMQERSRRKLYYREDLDDSAEA